jgi:bifunctional DNase/RNase
VQELRVVGVRVELPGNQPILLLKDGIYIAELVLGEDRVVSARPSDAVALAVRTGAPIYGAESLLDEVGIEIPDEQEDEVEKFREFLDQISPEDFGAGSGSGGA